MKEKRMLLKWAITKAERMETRKKERIKKRVDHERNGIYKEKVI